MKFSHRRSEQFWKQDTIVTYFSIKYIFQISPFLQPSTLVRKCKKVWVWYVSKCHAGHQKEEQKGGNFKSNFKSNFKFLIHLGFIHNFVDCGAIYRPKDRIKFLNIVSKAHQVSFLRNLFKVEIFLEQSEVAFLSSTKICENLNFSTVHL